MTLPLYTRPLWIYGGALSLPRTGQIHIRGASKQWGKGSSICLEAENIGRRTVSYNGRGKTMGRHPEHMGRYSYPLVLPSNLSSIASHAAVTPSSARTIRPTSSALRAYSGFPRSSRSSVTARAAV